MSTKTKTKKMTREHREWVDRILEARKKRKDMVNFKSRQDVRRMEAGIRALLMPKEKAR